MKNFLMIYTDQTTTYLYPEMILKTLQYHRVVQQRNLFRLSDSVVSL